MLAVSKDNAHDEHDVSVRQWRVLGAATAGEQLEQVGFSSIDLG